MSIPNGKQNLNEPTFTTQYGTDNHGIEFSCSHINPLQKALVNNGIAKLNSVKDNLQNAIDEINDFTNEVLEFAKTRCENVRSINQELRNAVNNGCECECEPNYDNCPYCENLRDERDDLESDKSDLESDVVELKDKIQELENLIQEKQDWGNEIAKALKIMKKKFSMVKDLVENLEEL